MKERQRPSFPARLRPDSGAIANKANPFPAKPQTALGVQIRSPSGPAAGSVGLDSHTVRMKMVSRLAEQGVTDQRVLAAMGTIERHLFVDSALVNQAYEDTSLPIGLGQTISKPSVVARMIELLLKDKTDKPGRILEIGTGCGYQAAVLSQLATEVYSIERLKGLHEKARSNLRALRIPNLHLLFGDGMAGFPQGAPYAAIIAAAGGEELPQAWIEQLAVGGRLVAPVSKAGARQQALLVLDKTATGVQQSLLEAVNFVPLKSGIA
jgi:protein-L-isoaspartate(D-aspartate) O-methyltransferase